MKPISASARMACRHEPVTYLARAKKHNAIEAMIEVRLTIRGCDVRPSESGDLETTVRQAVEHILPESFKIVECHQTFS